MKKVVSAVSLVFLAGLLIVACKEEETPEPIIEGIPIVTKISPTAGPAGTVVTIDGENFSATPEANAVLFGTQLATVVEASANQLSVEVPEIPEDEPTSFNIRVTVDSKFGTSTEAYSVTTTIALNATAVELFTNTTLDTLRITNLDEFIDPEVTWASDNENVFFVDEEGDLSAVGAGLANLTATLGEFEATTEVLVLPSFLATGTKDVGDDNTVAMFWSNRAASELNGNEISSMANSITVTENDTLVVGAVRFDTDVATIWRNGVAEALESNDMNAYAASIVVDETEQLVAGMQVNEESIPEVVLWTNGIPEVIGDGFTLENVYDIIKQGEDVILGGYKYDDNEKLVATLWVNGQEQSLSNGSGNAEVKALAISGEDIIAVGYEGLNATLWRNHEEETLPFGEPASAYEILVEGTNEYIVGHSAAGSAFLLINGEEILLSQNNAKAYTVDVKDDHVLVGGQQNEVATVWWINTEGEIRTISLGATKDIVQSIVAQ